MTAEAAVGVAEAAATPPAGPELLEDDGTLLLVRTATKHPVLLEFADALDEQIPKANEALRFADLVTSEQGKVAFSDPEQRARFAREAKRNLVTTLEILQQLVEKTDGIGADPLGTEERMARKSLVKFAQAAQERVEAVKEKVSALARILGPEAALTKPPGVRKSKWADDVEPDAPLHEKYRDVLGKQQAGGAVQQTAREEREQAAREKAQQRKDAEKAGGRKAGSEPKPILVKYQGRGENPAPSDNLYVKGLPGSVTEEDIDAIFSQVGTVMSQKLKVAEWGAICFVRMANRQEATQAIERLNNTVPERLREVAAASHGVGGAPAADGAAAAPQKSTEAGMRLLQRLTFVRVDLSQPLGIFFNNDCVAQTVGAGTQAAKLGVPVGARAKALAGKALTKGTEQLVKRIGKAKAKGLQEVVLAYSPPPVRVAFGERPFGFMLGLDEVLGLFVIGEVEGPAKEKGVAPGLALVSINDTELVGLTLDECFQCLKEAPLPTRLLFRPVPKSTRGAGLEADCRQDDGMVILSTDEEDGAPATAGKAAVAKRLLDEGTPPGPAGAKRAKAAPGSAAPAAAALPTASPAPSPAPAAELPAAVAAPAAVVLEEQQQERLHFMRVDLSKPLGIFFDEACRAERFGAGMQAAAAGVPPGAQVRVLGGRPLPEKTPRLVKRMQKAKKKGLKEIIMGFKLPGDKSLLGDDRPMDPGRPVVSSSEDEADATMPTPVATTAPMPAPAPELPAATALAPAPPPAEVPLRVAAPVPTEGQSSTVPPALRHLTFVRVDLSQPLGIGFDDACVAEKVAEGMQGARFGIAKGARICYLGGRLLPQKTTRLVKRIQKAKKKGLKEVVLGFAPPALVATLGERPLGSSVEQGAIGTCADADVQQRLRLAPLPTRIDFLPPDDFHTGAVVSSSDEEDEASKTPEGR